MSGEKVFLYQVNPRKVITGLSGINAIRTAKSVFLTKEDVKVCLQKASVYRRFAGEGINERVTIGNIDRLHRENYVSEEDWEKVQAKELSAGHGKVEAAPVEKEEPKKETIKTPITEVKEEVAEEVVVEDESKQVEESDDASVAESATVIESDDDAEVEKEDIPVDEDATVDKDEDSTEE